MFNRRTIRHGGILLVCAAFGIALNGCVRTTSPTVSATNPSAGETGVAVNRQITAVFSEEMDPATMSASTFTLKRGGDAVPGVVSYDGVTATFNPDTELQPSTLYTAKISMSAGALLKYDTHEYHPERRRWYVGLLAGGLLAAHLAQNPASSTLVQDFSWSFTTGALPDTTPPSVSAVLPSEGSSNAALDANLTATFSEAMDVQTINADSFTLKRGELAVPGVVSYTGVTATFNPVLLLEPGAEYSATISTISEDLAGNALASDYEWSFRTSGVVDDEAPRVTFTAPGNRQAGVSLSGNLSATFSEPMEPTSISTGTFTLKTGNTAIPGSVNYSGVTAVFNPTVNLSANTPYSAKISFEASDRAGNALGGDFDWTFTTGAAPDSVPPAVQATSPRDEATNESLGRSLAASFSEAMDPLTINSTTFTLSDGAGPLTGNVSYIGLLAIFDPVTNLKANTRYTATIKRQVTDLAGNFPAEDFEWQFTTGASQDTTPPTVTFTVPVNDSGNVPISGNLAATFSEAMDPLTITTASFTLSWGSVFIPGTVVYAGTTAIFNPNITLTADTLYTATITSNAADLAGVNLPADYVWTFTTSALEDDSAPRVTLTSPASGGSGSSLSGNIAATFSEVMDPRSLNVSTFRLSRGATPVLGTVNYAGLTTIFNPNNSLLANTTYTAVISGETADLAGNPLVEDYVWSFTTGAALDTIAPTVTFTDPVDDAVGISVNKQLAVSFSESMNPSTVTTATFTLDRGATPIPGSVVYAGNAAIFSPAAQLLPNTTYTASVWMEAEDLAGNSMEADYVWSFTTGAALDESSPTVLSTNPVDGAVGVPINQQIGVTFSEVMDPLSITTVTFILSKGAVLVPGTVVYAGTTAIFSPTLGLTANTLYTAAVLLETTDLAGNRLGADYVWTFSTGVTTAQGVIALGAANSFAILAGSTVSSTGPTVVTGDLGVSPGTAVTGFPPGVLNGALSTGSDSSVVQAKLALNAAIFEASTRSSGPVSLPGDLSGLTLFPGLYTNSTSVMLSSGALTFDAQGDSNAVFLLQMGSTLTSGSNTEVILAGGAKAGNIYWQVGSAATLGTGSSFKGNILAETSITLATGAALEGRALTRTAAVSLDAATVTMPAL